MLNNHHVVVFDCISAIKNFTVKKKMKTFCCCDKCRINGGFQNHVFLISLALKFPNLLHLQSAEQIPAKRTSLKVLLTFQRRKTYYSKYNNIKTQPQIL